MSDKAVIVGIFSMLGFLILGLVLYLCSYQIVGGILIVVVWVVGRIFDMIDEDRYEKKMINQEIE